jgi:hypothetical protein
MKENKEIAFNSFTILTHLVFTWIIEIQLRKFLNASKDRFIISLSC